MAARDPKIRRLSSRIAAAERWDNDPAELRSLLDEARRDERITALAAEAPEMTPEQAARLRRLFSGTG